MAKTFNQMVTAAMTEVPVISPAEAHRRMQQDSKTLVIDPRDAADIPATGMVSGAMNIALLFTLELTSSSTCFYIFILTTGGQYGMSKVPV